MKVVSEEEWHARQARHRERLQPFVGEHLARRSRQQKHPVWDFLFEYYSFKPSMLLKWSPGAQVLLTGEVSQFASWKEFHVDESGARLDLRYFPRHRVEAVRFTIELLEATQSRAAFHGCFGLHEWAMLYQSEEVRHGHVSLRLSAGEIARFVESQNVRCSHYDAFRFFTPSARPLNVLQPNLESRAEMEQPGCIHANMDLYKWSAKYFPWVASDIIADAFEVARFARQLDMAASPYDLRDWGLTPICIETRDGRVEYAQQQREVAERARPVRAALIESLRSLLQNVEAGG